MMDEECELKKCFDEIAVLIPLGGMVICFLILTILLQYYWDKSRSVKKKLQDEEESKRSAVSQLESQIAQKQKAIDEAEEKLKTFKRDKDNVENDLAHTKKQLEIAKRESHIPRSPTGPPPEWVNKLKTAEAELKKERDQRLEKEKELSRFKRDKDNVENDLAHTKKQLEIAKRESHIPRSPTGKTLEEQSPTKLHDLEEEVKKYKRTLEDAEKAKDAAEATKVELETKLKKAADSTDGAALSLQTGISKEVTTKLESELKDLKNVKEQIEEERDRVRSKINYKSLEDGSEDLRSQLVRAIEEKDDALRRLSTIISSQVRDGNPDIADLSVVNRPTNLATQFSELYDNEWTDATNELEAECSAGYSKEELTRAMAKLLLDILNFAFEVCTDAARKQLSMVQQIIAAPTHLEQDAASQDSQINVNVLPKEFVKQLKDQRKKIMPDLSRIKTRIQSHIKEQYAGTSFEKCLGSGPLTAYTNACVQVSWLMNIQDPPMSLDFNEDNFDSLRPFTRSGPRIDYHVWPTVYLTEGGSRMAKGVAQFKDANHKKSL